VPTILTQATRAVTTLWFLASFETPVYAEEV